MSYFFSSRNNHDSLLNTDIPSNNIEFIKVENELKSNQINYTYLSTFYNQFTFFFRNVLFLLVFLLNITIIIIYGISKGISTVNLVLPNQNFVYQDSFYNIGSNDVNYFSDGIILIAINGFVLALSSLYFIFNHCQNLVGMIFFWTSSIIIVFCIGSFIHSFIIAGILLLVLELFIIAFYICLHRLMKLATMYLKIAYHVSFHQSLMIPTILIIFLQAIFCGIWFLVVFSFASNEGVHSITSSSTGTQYNIRYCTSYTYASNVELQSSIVPICSNDICYACVCLNDLVSTTNTCFEPKLYYFQYTLLILSLFWICSISTNVIACITSYTVSKFWNNTNFKSTYISSFSLILKTIIYSLGSICFGSLIVGPLKTIRIIFNVLLIIFGEKYPLDIIVIKYIQQCFIVWIHNCLIYLDYFENYFNEYAICILAQDDKNDFISASSKAMILFHERKWFPILNDNISDLILILLNNIVGILCCLYAAFYSYQRNFDTMNLLLFTSYGYFIGLFLCGMITKILDISVKTTIICLAQNPIVIQV